MLVVPASQELTSLFLSSDPERAFAQLISASVKVSRISPYRSEGALDKEAQFFGRRQLIADIMNRYLANYLMIGTRGIGKSSLLKAVERRYQGSAHVQCSYMQLTFAGDIKTKLAGMLQ